MVPSKLSSTYIILIPENDKTITFNDYRVISLCNLLDKIISKITASQLKHYLDKYIYENQFGFLPNQHSQDVVGIAQECLHSLKLSRKKAFILKLYLVKAYDCLDWSFLRLIFIQADLFYDICS